MAFRRYRGQSTFEIWIIQRQNGSWEHVAIRLKPGSGEREKRLPLRLKKQFVCRVVARFPIDAIRKALRSTEEA